MRLLLLLLSACHCFAQGFGSYSDLPFLSAPAASTIPDPSTVTGLEYRYEASDLNGTGSIQPSNTLWTDRIQGKSFKLRSTSGAGPVVTASSITFAGTSDYTNTVRNMLVWPSATIFRSLVFVVKP